MKLAISNIAWTVEQDTEVYEKMREYGFSGLEIAPTRIFPDRPYDCIKEAVAWKRKLQEQYGFVIPSMQSIWYGRAEKIFGTDDERKGLLEYTCKAIDFANAIGCKNLVFGCPKNRYLTENANPETALSFFEEMAEYALSRNTVIGLEANPAIYHTNYINTTSEAFQLIERVSSEGFALNLDIGTMLWNQESADILKGHVKYLSHIHVSEPYLAPIVERKLHREIAEILYDEGYRNFISIEMSRQQNTTVIENAMQKVQNALK